MTDKELDDYMKTVNPNFNSHIEKGTIEMSNEYYNLLEEKMARLINENQELKKINNRFYNENCKLREEHNITDISLLDENYELQQKYLNAVADYETTMFEKEQLNRLVNSCQEEIRQLKKQLENYKKLGFKYLQDKNNNLENQQKEFINYLEDESKEVYRDGGLRQNIFRQILQKYKSIIGENDV